MENSTPYEIIMSPADVFIAPEGEPFPAIDAAAGGNWAPLGRGGKRSQADGGVVITHTQTITGHSTVGATGDLKAERTGEELTADVTIEDLTLETYSKALNGNPISETAAAAGIAGKKTMGLSQGSSVKVYSLLVRGPSPEGDGMASQYEIPRCYQNANPAPKFDSDGSAAGLKMQFKALEDPNAANEKERFGRLITQTAPAL